jgi:predicted nucleic acid-binding protein
MPSVRRTAIFLPDELHERLRQEAFRARVPEGDVNVKYKLRLQLRDKPRISFTDMTSMIVMREQGIRRVLTADTHFQQVSMGFETLP